MLDLNYGHNRAQLEALLADIRRWVDARPNADKFDIVGSRLDFVDLGLIIAYIDELKATIAYMDRYPRYSGRDNY